MIEDRLHPASRSAAADAGDQRAAAPPCRDRPRRVRDIAATRLRRTAPARHRSSEPCQQHASTSVPQHRSRSRKRRRSALVGCRRARGTGTIAAHSSSTPRPVVASVLSTGGVHATGRRRLQRQAPPRSPAPRRSMPSRSALLTTNTSAISMMPALIACTSSPVPGTSTTTVDVSGPGHVHFVLSDADGLDQHDVEAGRVEHERRVAGRPRQPAQMAAGAPCCARTRRDPRRGALIRTRSPEHRAAAERAASDRRPGRPP